MNNPEEVVIWLSLVLNREWMIYNLRTLSSLVIPL